MRALNDGQLIKLIFFRENGRHFGCACVLQETSRMMESPKASRIILQSISQHLGSMTCPCLSVHSMDMLKYTWPDLSRESSAAP